MIISHIGLVNNYILLEMTSQESNLLLQENTFRLLQERESQTLGNSTTAELELQRQILHLQQELAKATQGNVPSEIRQDVSHSGGSGASGTNSSSLTSPSPVNTTPGLVRICIGFIFFRFSFLLIITQKSRNCQIRKSFVISRRNIICLLNF